ncbi:MULTISPECIES: tRNA (adenosine(37)-N6)-threonylcarbamoyltransferase complex dimerization subunit type 1 TsaB [unclassified Curtobacterium]|uniref:tRNA (adenosine(37)-N6)-threonylcarbamoyltransferase complex dimerization subunit type 1 TsaB n=1 Tax=unclassified Curtobacterium TaxID=257496 RepID=UPI00203C6624|nr:MULTISPECIES: tRNA (adenosine(37)-N6)-threonylcarbamoyltransferase complex dimerization subunit type 1 TsaB [unclassified Curtobacterium]MCM3522874.1 tRNA (adenosine(37)-N6)-threonylcarbamoyltransferase complex dimerization subunit type 1 TsaB [Curtobacterium sp. P97]MDB6427188.1 tRNA (adenosine(37)-N6)-threonylcarbamoyltransferase complex dimerization subunit type 1 TsaB [Curtobacterium sp. 20TX0008]MDP9737637.1 tRNA threonylcarbamoyl adenosine modification protein YeaZ [Curtobacterium sp. 2
MLLAIDTSAGTSVAVVDPASGRVLAERSTDDSRRHAEVIGPFLAEVLAEAGVTGADVTGVVAGTGPGPFTGLRVGIAAARTFAAARGVPLLPLVSHDAIAADLQRHPVVVLTDARRREVYWSAHDETGTRVAGPGLAKPADLDEAIRASRPEAVDWPRETVTTVPAGRLGSLAADRLASGAPFADDTPLYLRDPDVTVPGAPKRVVR